MTLGSRDATGRKHAASALSFALVTLSAATARTADPPLPSPDAPDAGAPAPQATPASPTSTSSDGPGTAQSTPSDPKKDTPPSYFRTSKNRLSDTDLRNKKTGDYVTGFPLVAEDPNTGYGAGLTLFYYDNGERKEPLFAYTPYKLRVYGLAFITTKGQLFTTLDLDMPYVASSPYRLRAYATFERNVSANYYGSDASSLGPLHYSGDKTRTFPWAPAYDDAIDTSRPDGTTYARYNNYVFARPAAHVSLERDLFGGVVRPILGFTVSHTYIRDYTGDNVNAIDASGNTTGAREASTLLNEDCSAGKVLGCNGGWDNLLKVGIAYDTRDFEPDPNSGIFADLTTEISLTAFGSTYSYGRVTLGVRGYYSPFPKLADLVVAARSVYSVSFGDVPFYELPVLSFTQHFEDGLGGVQSLRGYRGQRFVGKVMTFDNVELRWTFWRFQFLKANFAVTTGPFMDIGRVYDKVDFALDSWKRTQGGMLRIAWNEATVVGIEGGVNEEDYAIYVDYGHQF